MNIPCCHSIKCPGSGNLDYDTPIANLSAELPDSDPFIALNWGWDNNQPPLGSNWTANSCLGVCESIVSQDDANLCAARANFACLIGSWGTPPGVEPNGGPQTGPPVIFPPPGHQPITFTNTAQSCTVLCPDGLPFTYTVSAGLYVATTQARANSMAASRACFLAALYRVCLGAMPPKACVGQFFAQLLNPTGGVAPYTFAIVSGSLPPGLVLDTGPTNAQIDGTPTTAGNYSFSIRVRDTLGNTMTKSYAMTIVAFTPSTLPQGQQTVPYSASVVVTAGTAPIFYAIVAGGLPAGLTLTPATGLISGTPTTIGTSAFTVQSTDATGFKCLKDYSIQVVFGFDCAGAPTTVAAMTWGQSYSTNGNVSHTASMVGGTGAFHFTFLTPPACPSADLRFTGTLCNPTAAPISHTLTVPWSDSGNTNSGAPQTFLVNVLIDGVSVASDTRDIITGPFTDIVINFSIPAAHVSTITLIFSPNCCPFPQIDVFSNPTFTLS